MIRLNVFVRVSETNREKAIEAAKELTTCSLKEEGCIAYDTFESSTRHDVFMICETWQNAEVLAAHEKSPHFGRKECFSLFIFPYPTGIKMYEGLVQFLMNKCPFNPISRVIRFKFQQYIARVGRATGEMLDKPVLPKFLFHFLVRYHFYSSR